MVRTQLVRLETIMLNGIELLADEAGVLFTDIPDGLEVGAVYLSSLG